MSAEIHCPQCQQPLTQVGKHWVCPEHGQIRSRSSRGDEAQTSPQPSAFSLQPLRIFLSYGHDANEALVRRIYSDLKERKHDVWFDQTEIKFGDDWRRAITEGITDSQKVVSFLSKHSTRIPGVCLDEIGIALGVKKGNIQTILVESEREVKPPPGVGRIQWLDMHDWKNGHGVVNADPPQEGKRPALATGDAAWEAWYQTKLAEIIRVVESDESRHFAGEIEQLETYLKPATSDSRTYDLLKKGFTGRKWLFEAIEQWRVGDRASRVFWLTGAPGFGKSAIAAQLAVHGREVIAVEFCNWQQPDHKNPAQIIRTLAFQIATCLPDYRTFLLRLPQISELDSNPKNESDLFDYLLAEPLRHAIDGGRERLLIVIDALDEASEAGNNALVNMLAAKASLLPGWIGLVVTSRPESNVTAPLQGYKPHPFEASSEENLADLREYLRRELATPVQNRPDADRLVEQILEKSEGVFLYIERFCDDVQHHHLSLDRPEQFPQGLGGIFFQWFQRQFPNEEQYERTIEPMLGAILAAREPLPVEILQKLLGWRETELRKWLRKLGSIFSVTTEVGHEVIKPYHKSLADWLTDDANTGVYFVSVLEGHRALATMYVTCWVDQVTALSEVIYQLTKAHQFNAAKDLLFNPDFQKTKIARLSKAELLSDFVWAILIYVANDSHQMLVIYGSRGCGKTVLLARTFQEALADSNPIIRFIGATPRSSNIRSLLSDLCLELRQRNPRNDELPANITRLSKEFREHLLAASDQKTPLIIFLDALDQLSNADNGRSLDWIPLDPLPKNVKLIASCLSDRPEKDSVDQLFASLQRRELAKENVINLDDLAAE
jgi:Cdc6-like AAA superfamily ATPase